MDADTIKKRVAALTAVLKKRSLGGAVITDRANVTYLTGFGGDDSWALIIGPRVWLLTDSRYIEQARGECVGCKIIQCKESLFAEVAKITNRFKSAGIIGIENTTPVALFDKIRKKTAARFKKIPNLTKQLRAIKEASEVAAIRRASRIADKALDRALKRLKVGMTESELAGRLEFEIRKSGALVAFETIVCFGANASRPHHIPGNRRLRKNDTILIDFGAKYKGYNSDKTRCFVVGKVNRGFQKAYDAVALAQKTAIDLITEGVKAKDIDAAAREVIKNAGFAVFGHGLGHGLGLEVHELPVLSLKSKDILKAGQVVTVEPGIYIPGKFGIRIEDDVLVTKTGFKILTRTKISPHLCVIKCK
ncbi:MAG TPA: aminopeptidase P family protein [Planctomycetes bacterium]|nr:aminopeptidase P family protein [Planctomycetota bacterium]HIJ70511.1 aminopeptidase P family protein [Planctomycetota bacterium]